jgi:hypothetical protein
MVIHSHIRGLMQSSEDGVPGYNFVFAAGHEPSAGDPLDPNAACYQWHGGDDLELFKGELLDSARTRRVLGRVRQPNWQLLSAGVVMRSHACDAEGTRFLEPAEACDSIHELNTSAAVRARAITAWTQLLSDLRALGVTPVCGEAPESARSMWRSHHAAVAAGDSSDGGVALGSTDDIEVLVQRLASGDCVAAAEWATAYQQWVPRGRRCGACVRDMAAPARAEVNGVPTRYVLPPAHGTAIRRIEVRGRRAPSPTVAEREVLSRYAQQQWRVSATTRDVTCARGTPLSEASVIVQLFHRALPITVRAWEAAQEKKLKQRAAVEHACRVKGVSPPAVVITDEERSWEGGPGFSEKRSNALLHALLRDEQLQGFPYTHAAVGDGSWDRRGKRVTRAALLHNGDVVGGALDTSDVPGGTRTNYDGELAHKLDVLNRISGARLLYVFDSTSPIEAAARFRRCTTTERARAECDDWQGTAMSLEEAQQSLVYWWDKSHTGSVLEGSVDALAKHMESEYVPVPLVPSRHVSLRFYAKRGERELALVASTLHLLRHYRRGDAMRASVDDVDALRAARLCERDQLLVRMMRADRARLQASRAYPDTGVHSAGAYLRRQGCPCGGGPQTQSHLLWTCTLPGVVAARADAKAALQRQRTMLDECESVTRDHMICRACYSALDNGSVPRGHSGIQGITPVQVDDADAAVACARHMLGVVRRPTGESRLNEALRASKPILLAVLAMQRAAESASIRVTAQVVGQALRHAAMRHALSQIQLSAWLQPAKRALVPVAAPPRRQLRSQCSRATPVLAVAVADIHAAAGFVRSVLRDGGGDQPRRLRALDAQLSHVLAAEAHIASVCVRDADDDETVGAIVETVEASQRLLTAWRARVAAAPGETRRRQRARAAEEARVAAARAAVPALSKSARMAAAAAAAARREGEQRAARALAIAQATRVLDAAANAGVRPALVRGGVRRRAAGSSAAAADMQRAVTVRAAVAAAARATAAASSVLRGGSGGVLAVATEAARAGAIVGRLCGQVVRAATVAVRGVAVASGAVVRANVRPRSAMDDDVDAGRVRTRARVVAVAVGRGRERPRDADDGDADAARSRKRVCVQAVAVGRGRVRPRDGDDGEVDAAARERKRTCVVATAVVCERKRARDGDDEDGACQSRVVRARRVVEAGGAPTPHHGGGGILSGSGAV